MGLTHWLTEFAGQLVHDLGDGHNDAAWRASNRRGASSIAVDDLISVSLAPAAAKHARLSSFLADAKHEEQPDAVKSTSAGTGVALYNPENRRIFVIAAPVTVLAAGLFEYWGKSRLAETDLAAPLPKVVEAAEKEEEASSLRSAIKVLEPYVTGPTSMKCAGYAAAHIALLAVALYVDVALTQWNGVFWSALQNHKSKQFYSLLWDFIIITGVTGFVGTYSDYLNGMWHLHARDHLTRHFNGLWVGSGAMCMMRQCEVQVDNPDQRIDQDVDEFVGSTRELFFGGLGSLVRLAIYFPILLRSAPSPLLGFVLVWPVFGAAVTHKLGRSLVPLSLAGESANANFRSELVHARDKAESLALMQAGPQLAATIQERFEVMKRVAYAEFDITKFLNFFKMMYEEYGTVVPFVLLAPAYFTGALDLGQLMQLRMIVERVSASLTFPVAAYEQAVGWRVAANRLAALQAQAVSVAAPARASPPPPPGAPAVSAEDLSVMTPEGRLVLNSLSFHVSPGERVLIVLPPSGGKSLLLRSLAGLWSHTSGSVEVVSDAMFVQGFEFPSLPLRQLLCYPEPAEGDAELVLPLVGLQSLLSAAERAANWEDLLSQEQQQRLSFARVLLRGPSLAVLDEPLASLDAEEASQLLQQLPAQTAVLTLSRTKRLAAVHGRVLELEVPTTETWVPSTSEKRKPVGRPARLGHRTGPIKSSE